MTVYYDHPFCFLIGPWKLVIDVSIWCSVWRNLFLQVAAYPNEPQPAMSSLRMVPVQLTHPGGRFATVCICACVQNDLLMKYFEKEWFTKIVNIYIIYMDLHRLESLET